MLKSTKGFYKRTLTEAKEEFQFMFFVQLFVMHNENLLFALYRLFLEVSLFGFWFIAEAKALEFPFTFRFLT